MGGACHAGFSGKEAAGLLVVRYTTTNHPRASLHVFTGGTDHIDRLQIDPLQIGQSRSSTYRSSRLYRLSADR